MAKILFFLFLLLPFTAFGYTVTESRLINDVYDRKKITIKQRNDFIKLANGYFNRKRYYYIGKGRNVFQWMMYSWIDSDTTLKSERISRDLAR